MAKSNPFWNIFHSIFPFRDFLYLLQLEEYYYGRAFKTLARFFWRRNIEKRDHLKWTARTKITWMVSVLIFFLPIVLSYFFSITHYAPQALSPWASSLLITLIVSAILIPLWIALANLILTPLFVFARWRVCQQASTYLHQRLPNATVIAITGSYGKTTTKNFLEQLLRSSLRLQITPGNINTAVGIAHWMLKDLHTSTQVLIIEMDAYKPGEIRQSCKMVNPDISLITTIGDQHLEKFGSQKRLARSLLETFEFTKLGGTCLVSEENRIVIKKWNIDLSQIVHGKTAVDIPSIASIKTSLSSESAKRDLAFAIAVARLLHVPKHFIEDTCQQLELPDRRQKLSSLFGYEIIDDSYNISFTTALAGLARSRQEANGRNKKLLVMTAGIAEMNKKDSHEKNRELGQALAKQADEIVLLKSIYYPFVLQGLKKSSVTLAADFQTAWNIIREKFSPQEYFILMQPELTDLSY